MLKMSKSNVLIIGLKGLGVEIAKNIALAGVKSLTLYDPTPVSIQDLSTQFFLSESDINKPRDQSSLPSLSQLNQYVPISILDNPNGGNDLKSIDFSKLSQFQVIVATEISLDLQLKINDFTRQNGISFISTAVYGLFGNVFVDLGPNFTVIDQTGEDPLTGIISNIDDEGNVTVLEDHRHGLEDGDFVKFTEVSGLDELNNGDPYKITVKNPYSFNIGPLADKNINGKYLNGGNFIQVKMPKVLKFNSLHSELKNPTFLISDFAKFDRPNQLHLGFIGLNEFIKKSNTLPNPYDQTDASKLINIVKDLAIEEYPSIFGDEEKINEDLITELSYQARGDLPAMTAFFGGLVAQEVLKASSGKFTPIKQWLYFDSLESLPTETEEEKYRSKDQCSPINSRYDPQIAVFGKKYHEKLINLKVFLVGSGAIGCEMLKNWSLLGLGTGPKGQIIVTDNDSIEKSNLNRQFLFRSNDVGKQKSTVASNAVIKINPQLIDKIKPLNDKVGPETEDIFTEKFWEDLDIVINALDNVEARTYVDRRCVFFKIPLLESGTLGTKGNTQVIIPNLTESYSSSQDPPEKSIPLCTLRSFPNKIDHTIAWAKSLFQGFFIDSIENVNLYLSQPNFIESILQQAVDQKSVLETIKSYLVDERPITIEDCISWARLEFEKKFNFDIQQLLYNFPKDAKTTTGAPFWSGPKRAPNVLIFDINDSNHFDFVVAAANLRAFNFGLKGNQDFKLYSKVISKMNIPSFSPKSDVKIQASDSDPDPTTQTKANQDELTSLAESLPTPSSLAGFRLNPVEFEKDDDTNHHIQFINAASNCRALNYNIEPTDKQKTKFIAGKIIPAIATTTALVTGLVCLELYKVIDEKTDIEQYKNGFVNLALPFFGFSEPIKSGTMKYNKKTIDNIWGRFDIYGNLTLKEIVTKFKSDEGLSITMLSYGVSLLYASFFPKKRLNERYDMKITELIELITKSPIPDYKQNLILEICADDENDEDVEVPYIVIHLDK